MVEVLQLRQSLHTQAPAGCPGCMCSDILTISDIFVYMIHMQLCFIGAPVGWNCINQFLSGWCNFSCSTGHLNWTDESVPDCEIFPVPPVWLCFLDNCSSNLVQLGISISTNCDKEPHKKISSYLRYDPEASLHDADEQYQLHPGHHHIQIVKSSGKPFSSNTDSDRLYYIAEYAVRVKYDFVTGLPPLCWWSWLCKGWNRGHGRNFV